MNQTRLSGQVAEISAARFTPAGIPVLEVRIDHESAQDQAGQIRQVKASIKAVAFGVMADRLRAVDLGQTIEITGFLANSKNGKVPVLHMQDFSVVQIIS